MQCLKWSARGGGQLVMNDRATADRKLLRGWPGMGYFLILSIKMVHSGVLVLLFCTVNWLDVEGLNNEVGG